MTEIKNEMTITEEDIHQINTADAQKACKLANRFDKLMRSDSNRYTLSELALAVNYLLSIAAYRTELERDEAGLEPGNTIEILIKHTSFLFTLTQKGDLPIDPVNHLRLVDPDK